MGRDLGSPTWDSFLILTPGCDAAQCAPHRPDVPSADISLWHSGAARVHAHVSRPATMGVRSCPGTASFVPMDFTLTDAQLELQARARAFVTDVLQPREAEFERLGGRVSREWGMDIRRAAMASRLHGGSFPQELGGQGWTVLEQVLVHEQLGRSTGGLWSFIPGAYNALIHCTPEQRKRYLDPSLRGERTGSYAITEDGAGSDARALAATAVRDRATGDYVLDGEKWFVTGPDDTDFMIFHAVVHEDGQRLPTLFLVDYDTPGVTLKHDPDYTHTFADRHPQFVLRDVRVAASAILGQVGAADELTNEWFIEERIHIGARCSGAMARLLELAVAWATERVQFGERIYDFQGVSFPLADSAADAAAARLLTREAAVMADTGADRKVVHARASLAKLFASEAAYRCADRVVQVFGGRGYMREYPPERFLRELRVDRIWEGTSEIQRLIIARALEKRGVDRVVG
jgi:acyl-CoA dehydrogenase